MMLIVMVCVVCSVMMALVAVAYQVLNKPVETKAPLVSDAIAHELMAQQAALNTGPKYTMVSNSYLGSSAFVISQTVTVNPKNCSAICNNDRSCGGFQMHSDGTTCDIIASSNIGGYPFTNTGWAYYQLTPQYTPNKIVSKVPDQAPSGAQVGVTLNVDVETCSKYCSSNTTCTEFTMGPTGCKMWNSNDTSRYIAALSAPGTDYYRLTPVQATQAFSSAS